MQIPDIDAANSDYNRKQAAFSLIGLLISFLVGMFVSQFVAFTVALPFVDFNHQKLFAVIALELPHPYARLLILGMQSIMSLGMFTLAPYFFLKYFDRQFQPYLNPQGYASLLVLLLTVMTVIASMPFGSVIVEWNQQLKLPGILEGFERWALLKENTLKDLTLFLVDFHGPVEFIVGFVAIAILPAIGEELLFRGVLQNKLRLLTGNIHIAIWLSAFIFSAFHLQFYGLFPRMLLGALFGYMYFWSGSLTVPMLAHLANNGFTLIILYLNKQGVVDANLDEPGRVPQKLVWVSLALTIVLLVIFKKVLKSEQQTTLTNGE